MLAERIPQSEHYITNSIQTKLISNGGEAAAQRWQENFARFEADIRHSIETWSAYAKDESWKLGSGFQGHLRKLDIDWMILALRRWIPGNLPDVSDCREATRRRTYHY